MILNNDRLNKLNSLSIDDIYILTDFDGTITQGNSDSSWASIFKNPKVSKDFIDECIKIFNYYHKYEIDDTLSMEEKMPIMNEWYERNIETLKKFKITEEIINYAARSENNIRFRDGAKKFLKIMQDKNVPVIIISSGVGNIIEEFLNLNGCNYSNIHICSNFLEYTNGLITSVKGNNIINPLNKNEISLSQNIKDKLLDRKNIILLGNSVLDINMASPDKNVYKIGFLDERVEERLETFKDNFDFVFTNNESYDEVLNKIKVLSK